MDRPAAQIEREVSYVTGVGPQFSERTPAWDAGYRGLTPLGSTLSVVGSVRKLRTLHLLTR